MANTFSLDEPSLDDVLRISMESANADESYRYALQQSLDIFNENEELKLALKLSKELEEGKQKEKIQDKYFEKLDHNILIDYKKDGSRFQRSGNSIIVNNSKIIHYDTLNCAKIGGCALIALYEKNISFFNSKDIFGPYDLFEYCVSNGVNLKSGGFIEESDLMEIAKLFGIYIRIGIVNDVKTFNNIDYTGTRTKEYRGGHLVMYLDINTSGNTTFELVFACDHFMNLHEKITNVIQLDGSVKDM